MPTRAGSATAHGGRGGSTANNDNKRSPDDIDQRSVGGRTKNSIPPPVDRLICRCKPAHRLASGLHHLFHDTFASRFNHGGRPRRLAGYVHKLLRWGLGWALCTNSLGAAFSISSGRVCYICAPARLLPECIGRYSVFSLGDDSSGNPDYTCTGLPPHHLAAPRPAMLHEILTITRRY